MLLGRWVESTPYLPYSTMAYRRQLRTAQSWSPQDLALWIMAKTVDGRARSNNSVRQRLSTARAFLVWLEETGQTVDRRGFEVVAEHIRLAYPRTCPRTYGRVRAKNPARFLTYEQAYRQLLPVCNDGTWVGARDALIIRLGLLGLRAAEIINLTWSNYDGQTIRATGKKNRIRTVVPGPVLSEQLGRRRNQYESEIGRPVEAIDPMICRRQPGRARRENGQTMLSWGQRIADTDTLRTMLLGRAQAAGLGHLAPHDLRRSTASILHRTTGADGGHLYDLLDIQRVLDHADPATTMRSYLEPMDTDLKARAGATLD